MVLVQFACDEDYDDKTYSLLHPLSYPVSTPCKDINNHNDSIHTLTITLGTKTTRNLTIKN